MPKKSPKRRFVKRRRHIPKIENLYEEASSLGLTVKEYVDYCNYMNMSAEDRASRRNNSSTYDWGPLPFRDEKGRKIKDEKWEREKRKRRAAAQKIQRREARRARKSRASTSTRNPR